MKTSISWGGGERIGYKLFEKKMLHMERHVLTNGINPWLIFGLGVAVMFLIIDTLS